jgi:hypothetical protein
MTSIIERLRSLLGRGDDGDGAERDPAAIEEDLAIEQVEAAREAARADALWAISDTPGSADDPRR